MVGLDGVYMISLPDEEELGPPQTGEEEDEELDLTPLGRISIKGDTVENLDSSEEIEDLINTAFKRVHKQEKGVSVQVHVPIKNGQKGFAQAFIEMLHYLDYWDERVS